MFIRLKAPIKQVRYCLKRRIKAREISILQRKTRGLFERGELPASFTSLTKYLSPSGAEKIIQRHLNDSEKENTAKGADDICQHNFDLLGSGKVNLGEKINWHCDFKSGYRWDPKAFYLDIRFGDKEEVDVKVPWELSRFQHLIILGQAYWLTSNEKYTKEFVYQVEDWIENNPVGYGVNWRCTMDVAIRVCNWIWAYYYFKDSRELSEDFKREFVKSLYIHGKHIRGNLEKGWREKSSNHYLSDIVGFVYLGLFFEGTKEGQKWLNFGIKELKKEMQAQVYPDGCDFEASACYHRLVLELFFYSTLMIIVGDKDFNGDNHRKTTEKIFGTEYTERLYKMFEAVLYLLKPNGMMPQIGDNDNGRLHIFYNRNVLDMRYLLTFGAIFFKEPRFKVKEFGFCEEALWVFGENGHKTWQNLKENTLSDIKSKAFPDAGWYVMRNNKDYCLVSCGPNGQNGNGGHCHNDKLSFELMIGGKDVIIDPGTYVYTSHPEWRNKFRSTAFHNTVVIDNQEQNRFIENNLFSLKNDAKVRVNQWETTEEYDILDGEYYGYKRFKNPVIHRRKIFFNKKKKSLEITDIFKKEGEHNFKWNLVLSPDFKANLEIHSDQLQWREDKDPAFYSPGYGIINKTRKFTATLKAKIPTEVRFWIGGWG